MNKILILNDMLSYVLKHLPELLFSAPTEEGNSPKVYESICITEKPSSSLELSQGSWLEDELGSFTNFRDR